MSYLARKKSFPGKRWLNMCASVGENMMFFYLTQIKIKSTISVDVEMYNLKVE